MSSFIPRPNAFKLLQNEFDAVKADGGRFISMRGRRRVGKSRLVNEWLVAQNIPHVFFAASKQPLSKELNMFQSQISQSSLKAAGSMSQFNPTSWEATLRFIAEQQEQPAVIVIDEFPYLLESETSFDATIQKIWDTVIQKRPILLVLIGSDIHMMEKLNSYDNPLYGRPTKEINLPPFTPLEIGALQNVDAKTALDNYLVIGGFPRLAELWTPKVSREEFLKEQLSDSSSPLIVNGERIISSEFPTQGQPKKVLQAIGFGETSFTSIQNASGLNQGATNNMIKLLHNQKSMIDIATPFSIPLKNSNKKYSVSDPYLRFWLRFIYPNMAEIERGRGELIADYVENNWNQFAGLSIEPLIQESLTRQLPNNAVYGNAKYVGSFWNRSHDTEIDLVAVDDNKKASQISFVGSIKWREGKKFSVKDFKQLKEIGSRVPGIKKDVDLIAVSRTGYDEYTKNKLYKALGPEDIIKGWA